MQKVYRRKDKMTEYVVKTSRGKKRLGTFFGTRGDAIRWAKRHWKIPIRIVSAKTGKIVYPLK